MKTVSLQEAASIINDDDMIAIGGNTINRSPMSLICQLIKDGRRDLRLVQSAGGMAIDMLCLAGAVSSVDAGFVSYETVFGLAQHYRRAVQEGVVTANEHACYTVIQALRAAACGAPFMPVKGLMNSDLQKVCGYFGTVKSPFDGEEVSVVKALCPDVGIIQVSRADSSGNSEIDGSLYDDIVISRASRKVIVIAEKLIKGRFTSISPEKVHIPGFLVTAVAESPGGAWPCAHYGHYGVNEKAVSEFAGLKDRSALDGYINNVMAQASQMAGRFS